MLIPKPMMIVISILGVWAVVSGSFCVALCAMAKRPMPLLHPATDIEGDASFQDDTHPELSGAPVFSTVR